ncbi:hypothetical protein V8E54_014274 [Elaphomyces granulatus]
MDAEIAKGKQAFFKELEDLDNVSEGSGENSEILRKAVRTAEKSRNMAPPLSRPSATDHVNPTSLSRTPSVLQSKVQCAAADSDEVVKETPYPKQSVPRNVGGKRKRGAASDKIIDDSALNLGIAEKPRPSGRKRKKDPWSAKIIPEAQQIFKGLWFFFLPNNDISPARRLRIQRCQEYGAIWTQQWGMHVSHVIVEKDLGFQDVLKYLKLEIFPRSIALVNQDYPSDCIEFRTVLSPSQSRFLVKGHQPTIPKVHAPCNDEAPNSPPLKRPRRRDRHTPSPSPEDGQTKPLAGTSEPESAANLSNAERQPPNTECDVLKEFIQEAKGMRDLPLDPWGDEEDPVISGSSDQESHPREENQPIPDWQKKFTCMQKHDSDSANDNPNSRTIEVLQQMLNYYTQTSDHWRVIAYRKAIGALRRQRQKICTKSQALAIPGIGERLADKIEEIVCTNRLRRLENTNVTEEDRALQLFLGVYGVGFTQASKWVALGYRDLEDLRAKADLSRNQQIGVEHFHDFQQRIPRAEVKEHGEFVRKEIQKVDAGVEVIVGGSYRRGAADCGDIDVLITKPDASMEQIRTMMMDSVVPILFQKGFLQASLAISSRESGSKWHGASALPGKQIWRRIDLLFVPGDELGAALLYFTGNDIFNRSMRLLARKKGMCLNQHGLYKDVMRGSNQVKISRGSLFESRDEKRIFEILQVPWRPPEHRIC